MISGAPVLKVRLAGRITPTDFFVPSARVMPWLTHLPSKYTLALVATEATSSFSVVMKERPGKTLDFRRSRDSAPAGESESGRAAYPRNRILSHDHVGS